MYSRNAKLLVDALRAEFPYLEFSLNEQKPRRGAFEISLQLDQEQEILVWSGIHKAPRKAKFPAHEAIIDELKKSIPI